MKPTTCILALATIIPTFAAATDIDCSMSDSARCDCIYSPTPTGSLPSTDCRVCRINGQLMCVGWGTVGNRYGPLCEDKKCLDGKTWQDGIEGGGDCYCDWGVKEHDRVPCITPAGDCKCSYVVINGTQTSTSTLPGETCTLCATPGSNGDEYTCTETGNKKNGFGPLCMGPELGPGCKGRDCICNWMMTMAGDGWRNVTGQ